MSTYDQSKRKYKEYDENDSTSRTLADLNLELDNNMNEIIYLLGKRKNLIMLKKKKIRDDKSDRIESLSSSKSSEANLFNFELQNDAEFMKISAFSETPKSAINVLGRIVQGLPDFQSVSAKETKKSEIFWENNNTLENIIDEKLSHLRNIDKKL